MKEIAHADKPLARKRVQPPRAFTGFTAPSQFANDLGISVATLAKWIRRGLPIVRIGKVRLIEPERARAWVLQHRVGGGEPGRKPRHAA